MDVSYLRNVALGYAEDIESLRSEIGALSLSGAQGVVPSTFRGKINELGARYGTLLAAANVSVPDLATSAGRAVSELEEWMTALAAAFDSTFGSFSDDLLIIATEVTWGNRGITSLINTGRHAAPQIVRDAAERAHATLQLMQKMYNRIAMTSQALSDNEVSYTAHTIRDAINVINGALTTLERIAPDELVAGTIIAGDVPHTPHITDVFLTRPAAARVALNINPAVGFNLQAALAAAWVPWASGAVAVNVPTGGAVTGSIVLEFIIEKSNVSGTSEVFILITDDNTGTAAGGTVVTTDLDGQQLDSDPHVAVGLANFTVGETVTITGTSTQTLTITISGNAGRLNGIYVRVMFSPFVGGSVGHLILTNPTSTVAARDITWAQFFAGDWVEDTGLAQMGAFAANNVDSIGWAELVEFIFDSFNTSLDKYTNLLGLTTSEETVNVLAHPNTWGRLNPTNPNYVKLHSELSGDIPLWCTWMITNRSGIANWLRPE